MQLAKLYAKYPIIEYLHDITSGISVILSPPVHRQLILPFDGKRARNLSLRLAHPASLFKTPLHDRTKLPTANLSAMDITKFIVAQRDKALLVGEYGSYRTQLSRRLLTLRRKLNYQSVKGNKYAAKAPVSVEDVKSNHE